MNQLILKNIIENALLEDLQAGDITSEAIFRSDVNKKAVFIAKSTGIIAGLPVINEVYHQLNPEVICANIVADGTEVAPGTIIGTINGSIKTILAGERVALNFMQRLSGIATQTAKLAKLIANYPAKVVDTRKTTPGLRMLEKYAVRMGGGQNHRFNLADAILIKDNHIAACGSITEAVNRARSFIPHTMTVEVECETREQVQEALTAKADIIMLDNMTPAEIAELVKLIDHRAIVEASGNINETTIIDIAASGVDIISVGALTHSVKALDISLEID